ncbi:MAG: metallopeptidase TldD-related protein [Microthrixaceae bacterium]
MLAGIGLGLAVESFAGLHSGVNPVSGDFSVGANGLLIRDGQLAEPVREITIASSIQRLLLDIRRGRR